jgi:hypothetical protein
VETIESDAFSSCPLEVIKINCQPELGNSIKATLDKLTSSYYSPTNLKTLQITFSSLLTDKKTPEEIKGYVTDILALQTSDNAILDAISTHSGTFNLNLSNTGLTQSDINGLPNTLGWLITFG